MMSASMNILRIFALFNLADVTDYSLTSFLQSANSAANPAASTLAALIAGIAIPAIVTRTLGISTDSLPALLLVMFDCLRLIPMAIGVVTRKWERVSQLKMAKKDKRKSNTVILIPGNHMTSGTTEADSIRKGDLSVQEIGRMTAQKTTEEKISERKRKEQKQRLEGSNS